MRTLSQHITLHSFLVPHPWHKVIWIVCPKKSSSFAQCLTPCTVHSALCRHVSHYHWSPKVDHIKNPKGVCFTNPEPFTGYEPNRIVDNQTITEQEIAHSTEESQITEIEDKELTYDPFSLPYDQSSLYFTQDFFESIARPHEADLDNEQLRALLASPWYLPERQEKAERSQVYHSEREGLMSSSSQSLNLMGTGDFLHCFHIRKDWVKTLW